MNFDEIKATASEPLDAAKQIGSQRGAGRTADRDDPLLVGDRHVGAQERIGAQLGDRIGNHTGGA